MAARRPLVLVSGNPAELPVGDTVVGAGGGGSATVYEVEVDFGATSVKSKTFTVTDAGVSPGMKIVVTQSGNAPTGRSADENEMDVLIGRAFAGTGQFKLFVDCLTGMVSGKYKFNYMIGA